MHEKSLRFDECGLRAVRTKALVAAFIRSVSEMMIRKLQSNRERPILEISSSAWISGFE